MDAEGTVPTVDREGPVPAIGPEGPVPAIDPETLLAEPAAFTERLDEGAGPLAVVGPPFAGREQLLDHAATRLDATRVSLDPGADPAAVTDALGDGPLVVDGCHHLYRREVGGFTRLASVLDSVAGASETVVTGWNSYAWSYLDAVQDLETRFADEFEIQALSSTALAGIVREQTESMPALRNDKLEGELVERRAIAVGATGRTLAVPVPNSARVRARVVGRTDPEKAVFTRLATASNGNPGVALALWNRAVADGSVSPSDIDAPTADLGREEGFVLRLVLDAEGLDRGWLTDRVDGASAVLDRLVREGIVSVDGDIVRIEPVGVPAAVNTTKTWRIR